MCNVRWLFTMWMAMECLFNRCIIHAVIFLLQGPQGGQGMRGDKGPVGASVSPLSAFLSGIE